MKQSLNLLILSFLTLLCACSKEQIEKPRPTPGGQKTNIYRLVVENLAGISNPSNGLYAVASVTNEQNQVIFTDKKLSLSYNGKYRSKELNLPAGKYKLTKFVIFSQDNKVQYAAPVAGSEKAPGVSKPLSISFAIPNADALNVGVDVLGVLPTDLPTRYGYPAGAFSETGTVPDNNPNFRLRLKMVITNGTVVYDSIPATLRITTWDERNEWSNREIQLEPGTNLITLPKSATKFQFKAWQWGHSNEISLLTKDIDTTAVYILGGSREAKKLKSELTYSLVNGTYKADSKNEFIYGANGKLSKINYYLKRKDGTPYTAFTDVFSYEGNRVATIVKSDEHAVVISTTIFRYDGTGKVTSMKQNTAGNIEINAAVSYMNLNGSEMIQASYWYNHTSNELHNNMTLTGGNMVKMEAASPNMTSEEGHYQYDFQINPYANMEWPDLLLTRLSKNNVRGQQKSYSGNFPTADPYKFEYKYDDYGYPTELIKSFKSPQTGQHLFVTKTVYNY